MEATLRKTPLPVDDTGLAVSDEMLLDPLDYQRSAVRKALDPSILRPRILLAVGRGVAVCGGRRQPEIFAEVGDGVMADMAWDRRKVTVLGSEAEQTDVDDLRSAGWTVIRVADGDIEQAVRLARAALMSTKD